MFIYGHKKISLSYFCAALKCCCLISEWLIKMMQHKVHMQLLLSCMYEINCRSLICVKFRVLFIVNVTLCFMDVQ